MHLTRREFASTTVAAATAGGLSLFSWQATLAVSVEPVRHAHLELPAGPYTRAELSKRIASAAQATGYAEPVSVTALGTELTAETFPAQFALTLCFPSGTIVVRASQRTHAPELTLRGQHTCTELRYSECDETFCP